jgi:hypothetical protein
MEPQNETLMATGEGVQVLSTIQPITFNIAQSKNGRSGLRATPTFA